MPAGKGGRAAKGGRGKGSSQSRKAVKTVKADDLEFLSSDEDDEPNTMKVLRSLLVERGSSGTVADLVKRGRPKSEQTVNVECKPDQLRLLQSVLKEQKRSEEQKERTEMATAVADIVIEKLSGGGAGLPRTDMLCT